MGEGRLWERLRIYSGKLFIAIKGTIPNVLKWAPLSTLGLLNQHDQIEIFIELTK